MTDKPAPPPMARPSAPETLAPAGACDAHVHMLAGPQEHPLYENRVEDPAGLSFDEWTERFRIHLATLNCSRAVVVQSILYGADNTVALEAVRRLGDAARGIGLVADNASEAELDLLADQRISGVRLNFVHGGILSWPGVMAMAPRLAARGLHVEMLVNARHHMDEIADAVEQMPVPVVFDHIAWPDLAFGPDEPGFARLLRLLADGNAWTKLSGIYRLDDAPHRRTDAHVAALVAANPERCLWGSDWPHIMLGDAAMPDAGRLLDSFHRVVADDATRRRILVENPARLYGFETT